MCGGYGCSRSFLTLLNLMYMLVSFVLIGVAGYAVSAVHLTSLSIVGGLIFCGVLLFIISLLGIIGAAKHHQVLLFFYMVVLFLLFLIQFILAVVCLGMSRSQQEKVFEQGWKHSSNKTKASFQENFQCCGFDESRFNVTANDAMFHPSCAKLQCCGVGVDECCTISGTPCSCPTCWDRASDMLQTALHAAGGVGLFFSFTEIIGVWLAFRFRNQKNPKANPDAFL